MQAEQKIVIGCFGGGVDSTTLIAMDLNRDATAAWLSISRSDLDSAFPSPAVWLFSDTGAEHQGTYDNIAYMKGLMGDRLITVRRDAETILEWNLRLGTVPLMPGSSHICSLKYKGEVMEKYADDRWPNKAIHWIIGFEAGEGKRVTRFQKPKGCVHESDYPLMTLNLTRERCVELIDHLGFDVPIKSSCIHCPFKTEDEIRWMYFNDKKAWNSCIDVEVAFKAASKSKNDRWIAAGKPLSNGKRPRAPKGMWRLNSWAEGARLFARMKISVQELGERFEATTKREEE